MALFQAAHVFLNLANLMHQHPLASNKTDAEDEKVKWDVAAKLVDQLIYVYAYDTDFSWGS